MVSMKITDLFENSISPNSYYLYLETAFIHEGDIEYLYKLIDAAIEAECDGIKFQLIMNVSNAYSPELDINKKMNDWLIDVEEWSSILNYVKERGVEVICLPIDLEAANFCMENNQLIDGIEIHSICFNDYHLLKILSTLKDIPIILGLGGRTLEEIEYAWNILGKKENIILMYGFQSFPTKIDYINLSKISFLRDRFDFPIGYADHTGFNDDSWYNIIENAYFLGARVFEKHIALNKGEKRIDFESAVDISDISNLKNRMEQAMKISGKGDFNIMSEAEQVYRNREKQLVYSRDIRKGETIDYESMGYKVSSCQSDFEQKDIKEVVKRLATRDLKKNSVVKRDDVASKN